MRYGAAWSGSKLDVLCAHGFIVWPTTRRRTYIVRQRRANISNLSTLEEIEASPDPTDHQRTAEERIALDRLLHLIHRLKPMDRQVMLLYLEDMDAESIGEITGISAGNVRVLIHRVKKHPCPPVS